jgi:hypothetical protein
MAEIWPGGTNFNKNNSNRGELMSAGGTSIGSLPNVDKN